MSSSPGRHSPLRRWHRPQPQLPARPSQVHHLPHRRWILLPVQAPLSQKVGLHSSPTRPLRRLRHPRRSLVHHPRSPAPRRPTQNRPHALPRRATQERPLQLRSLQRSLAPPLQKPPSASRTHQAPLSKPRSGARMQPTACPERSRRGRKPWVRPRKAERSPVGTTEQAVGWRSASALR